MMLRLQRFEDKGLKLVALKLVWPSKTLIEQHYGQHINRHFYLALVKHMISGPVVPMIWDGKNVVKITRRMLGPSDPNESIPGTIRADFSADIDRSIVHGSHSIEAAKKEIRLWFRENELVQWTQGNAHWIRE